jgi:hypothetical protein
MSTSASDDSSETEVAPGEILKASSPGPDQLHIGMEVMSLDGERVGQVKSIHADEFLVDRQLARDLWIPFTAMFAAEDYNPNFRRGPAEQPSVVLNVTHAHVDDQGWRHA